jgi:D-aminopeptidase
MALIAETLVQGAAAKTVTTTTLTASDTLVYRQGAGQLLFIHNGTGGSLSIVVNDPDVTSVQVNGVGTVSTSAGVPMTVAAGARAVLDLDKLNQRWVGTVNVTAGTGATASLLAFR